MLVFKLYYFHHGANEAFECSSDFWSHLEVVCICYFQMIWTWTQPVRPSCVQFSLLVNQASFTDAPAARSKESAVCPENQLFIIYHLRTQCKIEFTYQSQKPPNLKVVKRVLNTQCYQYLLLTMWFHAKKSKETLKKSKSLILQCKFGARAQKWPKIAKKRITQSRFAQFFLSV